MDLVGSGQQVVRVPEEIVAVINRAAAAFSEGYALSVAPVGARLSTSEAAEILGVRAAALESLVETGQIPVVEAGPRRAVLLSDVLEYQTDVRARRAVALDELESDAVQAGFYEAPDSASEPPSSPRRAQASE